MPIKHQKVKEVEAGIWLLESDEYLVDFRPNGSGRRFRKVRTTKADARQFKAWVITNHGKDPEWKPKPKSKTDKRRFNDLIDLWYELHGFALDDGKARKNKLLIMSDIMGNPIATKIDKELLAEYRPLRLASGIKPKTVNNEHGYLVSMFNTLIQLGKWKFENRVQGVKKLKIDEKELAYLEEAQIVDLLKELKSSNNHRVLMIVELCLSTGARWSEALHVHSRHIKNSAVQFVDTKNGTNRWVEIDVRLEKRLLAMAKDNDDGGYVFKRSRCEDQFALAVKNAGIDLPDGQCTHVLRHTFATTYLANGGDIKTLQALLGHKHLSSTMVYLKVVSAMKAKVVQLNPLARIRQSQKKREAIKVVQA